MNLRTSSPVMPLHEGLPHHWLTTYDPTYDPTSDRSLRPENHARTIDSGFAPATARPVPNDDPMTPTRTTLAKRLPAQILTALALASLGHVSTLAQETTAPSNSTQPAIQFRVLESRRVSLGNRSIVFNRVEPPDRPTEPAVATTASAPAAEEVGNDAVQLATQEEKKRETLFVSATVFDNAVTELSWSWEGHEIRAFSNINFNHLGSVTEFETSDTNYGLLTAIVNAQAAGQTRTIPALSQFSATRSEFIVSEDPAVPPPPDEALAWIQALHAYYDANKQQIIDEEARRQAAQAEKEQWLRDHPPVPKDTVINFWPVKSRRYPTGNN
jgi:hypothetical protein